MKKKMILLTTVLVLALGSLGVAYAAWTDEITIRGSVDTGSLCWRFVDCDIRDSDAPDNPGGDYPTDDPDQTCLPGFAPNPDQGGRIVWDLDKNVAWGECDIVDEGKTLLVTFHNVYPCYFNEIEWHVMNCGTVPLKVDHIVVTVDGTDYIMTRNGYLSFDVNEDGDDDWEMSYGDNFGAQLHTGQLEMSMFIHLLQPAPQGTTVEGGDALTFTIKLVAVQWDEYPLPASEY